MIKKKIFYKDFKCPSCWVRWEEKRKSRPKTYFQEKLCKYCDKNKNKMTDEMLLNQIIKVMPTGYVRDFPPMFAKVVRIFKNMNKGRG